MQKNKYWQQTVPHAHSFSVFVSAFLLMSLHSFLLFILRIFPFAFSLLSSPLNLSHSDLTSVLSALPEFPIRCPDLGSISSVSLPPSFLSSQVWAEIMAYAQANVFLATFSRFPMFPALLSKGHMQSRHVGTGIRANSDRFLHAATISMMLFHWFFCKHFVLVIFKFDLVLFVWCLCLFIIFGN